MTVLTIYFLLLLALFSFNWVITVLITSNTVTNKCNSNYISRDKYFLCNGYVHLLVSHILLKFVLYIHSYIYILYIHSYIYIHTVHTFTFIHERWNIAYINCSNYDVLCNHLCSQFLTNVGNLQWSISIFTLKVYRIATVKSLLLFVDGWVMIKLNVL